jgi:hypothetical protein
MAEAKSEKQRKSSGPAEVSVKARQNVSIGGVFVAVGETAEVPVGPDLYECVNAGLVEYAEGSK